MGRKKIKIQPIQDERNKQVECRKSELYCVKKTSCLLTSFTE